jgi:hypothetical protein
VGRLGLGDAWRSFVGAGAAYLAAGAVPIFGQLNRSRLAMQKAAIVLDNDGFLSLDSRCELRTIRDCG